MTKKTRLIILLVCVICFFLGISIMVPYSMGYRFDFKKMIITATGGIYIRTFPAADKITLDSKISEKPGLFTNYVFIQNLIPSDHTILINKAGYYDYSKALPVKEKQVTKIENVVLFKKNIQFELVSDSSQSPFALQEKYIIKNNNLYYSSAKENSALTATQKATPIIKKIASFTVQNNTITWLSVDGFLYKSDLTNLSTVSQKITPLPIKISKTGKYEIIANNQDIFVIADSKLFYFNSLDVFAATANDAKISPDGKNIVYYDNKNVYISPIPNILNKKNTLYGSSENIGTCLWINNDYIAFTSGNKIIISEIDYRGNINVITLPQTINISADKNIELKNPDIFFNQQTSKLSILTNDTQLLSEKITP